MRRPSFPLQPIEESFFDTAPFRLRETFDVRRPASQVWADLTGDDPLAWCRIIQRITWTTPPPYGMGTTRTARARQGDRLPRAVLPLGGGTTALLLRPAGQRAAIQTLCRGLPARVHRRNVLSADMDDRDRAPRSRPARQPRQPTAAQHPVPRYPPALQHPIDAAARTRFCPPDALAAILLRAEIIETVHKRRTPTISATAGLNMTRVAAPSSRSWHPARRAFCKLRFEKYRDDSRAGASGRRRSTPRIRLYERGPVVKSLPRSMSDP